jgi:hypothetical protein
MSFELITAADYEHLPSDPYQKFAAIEEICRRNMLEVISQETSQDFDSLVRTSYMTIVSEVADELGIPGIRYIDNYDSVGLDVQEFIRIVTGVVARIRLRNSTGRDGFSVRLASRTKGLIEVEVTKLREAVSDSDIEDGKKRKLLAKIEDFRTELHKERLGYAAAFSALAIIAAGVGGTTSFLANAPDAHTTVTKIIEMVGQDKEKEESEALRLDGPSKPKLITGKTQRVNSGSISHDFDDDIPF